MKCISTYRKALRLPKTEAGSDTSSFSERNRYLCGRREDRVRLTVVAIAAPSRVSQCVCARVIVRAYFPQETITSIEHTHNNGHRYANARNMEMQGICI